jgi:anthranilate synthase component 1
MIRLTPTLTDVAHALEQADADGLEGAVVPLVYELDRSVVARHGLDVARAFERTADRAYGGIFRTAACTVVATQPSLVYVGDGALDQLQSAIAPHVVNVTGQPLPTFVGGALGMLTHEFMSTLEPTVPVASRGTAHPNAVFLRVEDCIVFDHVSDRVLLIACIGRGAQSLDVEYEHAQRRLDETYRRLTTATAVRQRLTPDMPTGAIEVSVSDDEFEDLVTDALDHIAAGEVVQVVLSRSFDQPFTADPLDLFRALCDRCPSQYHTLLRMDGVHVVGASPEQLVGVSDGRVATNPIAGTRPRGATLADDAALAAELRSCPKERAEHMMLVDLGRNDVARVSDPGSVDVLTLAAVERGAHVMHLVSRVEGELADGQHPIDALRACFPAGTLTGAPKVRAAQLITELEGERRSAYGGAIGFIGHGGSIDMSITIRSAVIENGVARVQAGAGIVARSIPEHERLETEHKARGVLEAIAAVTARAAVSAEVAC